MGRSSTSWCVTVPALAASDVPTPAVVSALHVHMDAHDCLEVLVLRGSASDVISKGEGLVSTKGVKFGKLLPATTGQGLR